MVKTPKQEVLELQYGRAIEEVIRGALERFGGRHNHVALAALDLGVSSSTLYIWCAQMEIDVREYKTEENQSLEAMENLKQKVLA